MSAAQELLDNLRSTIADISKLIEDQNAKLTAALATRDRGLRTLRSFCPHADLVEVERPCEAEVPSNPPPEHARFCLTCGLMEHGIRFRVSGDPDYSDIRYERLRAEPLVKLPESALAKLLERLNAQGRFDEFDANGTYIGKPLGAFQGGGNGDGDDTN